jgi:hypothetical protein
MQIRHDAWCPKLYATPGECAYKPEVAMVSEDNFIAGVNRMNRAQRRAAEREARRADKRGGHNGN